LIHGGIGHGWGTERRGRENHTPHRGGPIGLQDPMGLKERREKRRSFKKKLPRKERGSARTAR